ncbi:MAG: hypothetical protein R2738_10685 [Bacteroides graminisolvens]
MARIAQSASGGQVGEDPEWFISGEKQKNLWHEPQDFDAVLHDSNP